MFEIVDFLLIAKFWFFLTHPLHNDNESRHASSSKDLDGFKSVLDILRVP